MKFREESANGSRWRVQRTRVVHHSVRWQLSVCRLRTQSGADLRPVSLPVEIQSFRVFRNIISQCHRQEMVPHAQYSRSTFASLLTESLPLRGQLMRMAS